MTFFKICWMLCTPGHTQFLGRHKSLIKLFKAPGGLDRYIAWKQVKPGFTTYQPQPNNSRALSKMKKKQQKAIKNNKTNI